MITFILRALFIFFGLLILGVIGFLVAILQAIFKIDQAQEEYLQDEFWRIRYDR